MSEKTNKQSRRTFLAAGTLTAASSIVAIKTSAATDPNYTKSPQTLTHKITASPIQDNVGTDAITIKEYPFSGTDITSALNSAITFLNLGGIILIPRGLWTSDGGHDIDDSISIEGAGYSVNPNIFGTEIKLNAEINDYMFRIDSPLIYLPSPPAPAPNTVVAQSDRRHISLKNLSINLESNSSATGLLMTNAGGGSAIYSTAVENVGFNYGEFGIKVDNIGEDEFECILNRFERVSFVGCNTAFSCNTIDGGYTFDNCYFSLPNNGTALDCDSIGNISLNHCLFVGTSTASSNATVLKTNKAYNNISFFDCQDEGVEFMYQNGTNNYAEVPIVFRNCLIQSKLKYTASGSVVFDSCWINITNRGTVAPFDKPLIYEVGYVLNVRHPFVRIYLKGVNNLYTPPSTAGKLSELQNPFSHVIYESNDVDEPFIASPPPVSPPAPPFPGYYIANSSRGVLIIPAGSQTITLYNNLAGSDSIILTQLMSYDSGGARIREVIRNTNYFTINLTQNAAMDLSIGFKVENYKIFQ